MQDCGQIGKTMIDNSPTSDDEFTLIDFVLRAGVIVNLVLISLTWWPRFSGSENQVGLADQLFGQLRIGGFRIDLVWLVLSSAVLFFASVHFFNCTAERKPAFLNGMFCVAGVLAFIAYIHKILTSGILWFG